MLLLPFEAAEVPPRRLLPEDFPSPRTEDADALLRAVLFASPVFDFRELVFAIDPPVFYFIEPDTIIPKKPDPVR